MNKAHKGRLQARNLNADAKRSIIQQLENAARNNPDYWNFREDADKLSSQKLFQYPAMMVPALQKQIISAILCAKPTATTVLDPFLGSGTILALAMLNGRSFVGQDINPLGKR